MPGAPGLFISAEAGNARRVAATCGLTPRQHARVSAAIKARAGVREFASFAQLSHFVSESGDGLDIAVVAPRDATGATAVSLCELIASERPRTAMVAYVRPETHDVTLLPALTAAGVHQVLFVGHDSGLEMTALFEEAHMRCAADQVLRDLAAILPDSLHSAVEIALSRPHRIRDVNEFADAMQVHRRTMFNRCLKAIGLPPAELLPWIRLALVAYLLETTDTTVERISLSLGFRSDTALRNTVRRYTGRTATEIRQAGGLQIVVDALRRRLETDLGSAE